MRRPRLTIMPLLLGLLLAWSGSALAQGDAKITQMLVESYDLLEAGKLDQAKAVFRQILQLDSGNPVALNNLGAVMVKEKKYQEALHYLEQALPRARGYKEMVNRVCAVDGLCLAFRPLQEVYGDQDLEPLVQFNIDMVKARLATRE
ncbi:MAG: tetratricopeptide repeat protein [Deltaproteobacteria bacterium]|nr:tetratricopeptide repeat protein [Deltaproteobacteria bacterium]